MQFIQERYVSFETAKLLHQHGFEWIRQLWNVKNEETEDNRGEMSGNAQPPFFNTCYNDEGKWITPKYYNPKNNHYPRPTQSMVMEWILKKYGKFIQVEYTWEKFDDGERRVPLYFARIIDIGSGEVEKIFVYEHEPYKVIECGILYILKTK